MKPGSDGERAGASPARLTRGDQLPDVVHAARSPSASPAEARALARFEAPGINTLIDGRTDIVLAEALGANVLDTQGNRYVDLISGFGVALLGHRHPAVVSAISEQANLLIHGLGDVYANRPRLALAEELAAIAPYPDAQVYFAVSGADAVEIALKTAVLHTGRRRVLAFDPGYHGLSLGALQVSSRTAFRAPFSAHAGDHVVRLPFACDPKRVVAELASGTFAAVIFEPIVGREGVFLPPCGWLASVLQAAADAGVVSIADEIFTGFRRTGPWFAHAVHAADQVKPEEIASTTDATEAMHADLICCGKSLGGGLPMGAVLGDRALFASWDQGGEALHTGTFVGHPMACAAALAVIKELKQPWVGERLAAIDSAFSALQQRQSAGRPGRIGVVEIRGKGALWAVECTDREAAHALQASLRSKGLLTLAGGPAGTVIQLVPPLAITDRQLDFVTHALYSEFEAH